VIEGPGAWYTPGMRSKLQSLRVAAAAAFVSMMLASAPGPAWAQGSGIAGAPYRNVSPAQLEQMLGHKDFFLVNVHIPYEGEIARTDAFIPFDRTRALIGRYPAGKDAKIVLYCRSGRMSDIAARQLAAAGYTNLYNLAGGMIAWQGAGLPLVTDPAKE
jgi:phage shock protein E